MQESTEQTNGFLHNIGRHLLTTGDYVLAIELYFCELWMSQSVFCYRSYKILLVDSGV